MAINGDYSVPVTVNGYSCKNCTDVAYAKKHIDPAHPKDDPYGINAVNDHGRAPAVIFGGVLSGAKAEDGPAGYAPGASLDLAV